VASEKFATIREVLENKGRIVVVHWLYRGSSAPARMIFDDFQRFQEYLRAKTSGGDAIDVWSLHDVCTPQNRVAEGKVPDLDGHVLARGAYSCKGLKGALVP
jgi:hypothetical protein